MAQTKVIWWLKSHPLEAISFFATIFLATFLRLYRIREYLTFLGDEGRDVRIVRDLITQGNLVFIGPQTSVGNMYLGPLYYYMMAPALFLSRLDPVGPAIMVAIIGVATVALIWYVTRKYLGSLAGLISSTLFAISPVALIYSRSSWNPDPMPLFALLSVWAAYEAWQKNKAKLFVLSSLFLACAIQMHYLGVLLAPVIFILWFVSAKKAKATSNFFKYSILSVLAFAALMSPLALFDIKHNFLNLRALTNLVFGHSSAFVSSGHSPDIFNLPKLISTDLLFAKQSFGLANLLLFLPIIVFSFKSFRSRFVQVLILWLAIGLIGLGLYKNDIYIHYLGFIYPAIYILFGSSIAYFIRTKNYLLRLASLLFLCSIIYFSFLNSPLMQEPNRQLARTQKVVDIIIQQSAGNPFNFGLIAKNNYDESYRYFLENKHANLVRGEDGVTNQLFVVCEDGDKCQPEGNSQWQIAVFGIAKVDWTSQIDSIKIYRLTHPNK